MGIIKNPVQNFRTFVTYKGEIKCEKPDGYGRASYVNGSWYEGKWKQGKHHGHGRQFYPDGTLRYEGEYKNGKRHGYGSSYYTNGLLAFKGIWRFDRQAKRSKPI